VEWEVAVEDGERDGNGVGRAMRRVVRCVVCGVWCVSAYRLPSSALCPMSRLSCGLTAPGVASSAAIDALSCTPSTTTRDSSRSCSLPALPALPAVEAASTCAAEALRAHSIGARTAPHPKPESMNARDAVLAASKLTPSHTAPPPPLCTMARANSGQLTLITACTTAAPPPELDPNKHTAHATPHHTTRAVSSRKQKEGVG
jgi:hypothetical protein